MVGTLISWLFPEKYILKEVRKNSKTCITESIEVIGELLSEFLSVLFLIFSNLFYIHIIVFINITFVHLLSNFSVFNVLFYYKFIYILLFLIYIFYCYLYLLIGSRLLSFLLINDILLDIYLYIVMVQKSAFHVGMLTNILVYILI